MQELANSLIETLFEVDPVTWKYTHFAYIGVMFAFCSAGFGFAATFSGVCVWAERKIAARIQSRVGPNRQGPMGFFIWIYDAVKLLLKEDLIPDDADQVLFRLGPYLVLLGLALSMVVMPFGAYLIIADINIALFYILAVTSIEVIGILISGWGSNSKWALLGGFRSAAQIISYEIPIALVFMVIALSAGTLSMQGVIAEQGAGPWDWYLFRSPMHFIAFGIYVIAALAEGNRTPFDLPEAEQELVGGFNTEYSGLRFSVFFLAEFANVWVMNALGVLLFLGGWQVPFAASVEGYVGTVGLVVASVVVFTLKTTVGILVVLWIRWTLPRLRIDQMMNLCWKYLVPIGIGCVVLTAAWEIALHSWPIAQWVFTIPLMALAAFLIVSFFRLTAQNIKAVGDEVDFTGNW